MPDLGAIIGGCILLFCGCTISSAGGVGGGGLNLPILLVIFDYSFSDSVNLSLYIVMGNALAQTLINVRKTHPTSLRSPLIFWELVIILLPTQMGGSNIGSILSRIFPVSILYVLAFIVLLYASTISLKKGLHKWHEESNLKANLRRQSICSMDVYNNEVLPNFKSVDVEHGSNTVPSFSEEVFSPINTTTVIDPFSVERKTSVASLGNLSYIMEVPGVVHPVMVLAAIMTIWIVYLALVISLQLMRQCTTTYFVIFIVMYVPVLLAVGWGVYYNAVIAKNIIPAGLDTPPAPANSLDLSQCGATLAVFSFVVGIICSLLGLGGGELYGPMMLSYGVAPQVTSATTSTLILLNSIVNVIRNLMDGGVDVIMGFVLFVVGLVSGCCGRQIGMYVANRYGRPSVIILALVVALYLSCIYYVYILAVSDFDSSMGSFC